MKTGMRTIKNLIVMAAVVMAGIFAMPQNVWATNTCTVSMPTSESISLGEEKTITLTYTLDADDSDTINISVSGTAISTIPNPVALESGAGPHSVDFKIKGMALGDSTITAEITGTGHSAKSATCNVHVGGTESISVDKTSVSLSGSSPSTTATATANYSSSDLKCVFDDAFIKIDGSSSPATITSGTPFTITALKKTTTPFNIEIGDATKGMVPKKYIEVSIAGMKPVTGLSLDAPEIILKKGDSSKAVALTVTPVDTDSEIEWVNGNESLITFSSKSNSGATIAKVSGVGTTTIAARADGVTVPCSVKVTDVEALDISPTSVTEIYSGQSVSLDAIIKTGTQTSPVSYSWTVTGTGLTPASGTGPSINLTAANPGPGDISATVKVTDNISGVSASRTITVKPAKSITGLTLNPTVVKVTKGFTVSVNSTIAPVDASTIAKLTWATSDPTYATVSAGTPTSVKVTGVKAKTDDGLTLIQKITKEDNNSATDVTQTAKVYVYDTPSISYSDNKLSITQPTSIYTGNSNNIDSVTKGVLKVYYGDNCLWTSDRSTSYKSGSTISASDIQSIIKKSEIYDKVKSENKDTLTLKFRIYGAGDSVTNDTAYGECEVPVYRITVSGTGIQTTKDYAVKGVEVKLTASPESNYTFSKWSDGTTTNPRTITVSGSNEYKAEAVSKTAANAAGGANANAAGGANGAGNSKLDKVPKTGEGNDVLIMWMILIVCSVAAGALLLIQHNQKKALMQAMNKTDKKN